MYSPWGFKKWWSTYYGNQGDRENCVDFCNDQGMWESYCDIKLEYLIFWNNCWDSEEQDFASQKVLCRESHLHQYHSDVFAPSSQPPADGLLTRFIYHEDRNNSSTSTNIRYKNYRAIKSGNTEVLTIQQLLNAT